MNPDCESKFVVHDVPAPDYSGKHDKIVRDKPEIIRVDDGETVTYHFRVKQPGEFDARAAIHYATIHTPLDRNYRVEIEANAQDDSQSPAKNL
jgi:hypothetical protein